MYCICSGRKNIPVISVFTSHFCSNGGTVRSWTLASGKPLDSWEAFLLTVECDELPVAKQIGFRSWVVFIATDETTVLYSRLIDCFLFYLKILYLYCKKPVSHVAQEKIFFPPKADNLTRVRSRAKLMVAEKGWEILAAKNLFLYFWDNFFLVLVLWHIKVCDIENS